MLSKCYAVDIDRFEVISITVAEENRTELKRKAETFLNRIRPLLKTGECTFAVREKNRQFDRLFPLKHQEKIAILLSLSKDDCVKIEPNDNSRYKACDVFVFLKDLELLSYGEKQKVRMYIKMYLNEQRNFDIVVVISFHSEGIHEEDI